MRSAVDAGCLMRLGWLQGLLRCAELAERGAMSHAWFCRSGRVPIHFAASNGHLPCLEWLVAKGADFHAQDGWVLLMSVTTFFAYDGDACNGLD